MSRILIVDDEESIREALRQALARLGDTEVAADGESALVKLSQGAYDLVVTDLRMGTASGLDVLRQAKASNPRCGVLMITAYGSVENAVEAMKAGADDYLTKPFSLEQVEHRAQALLEKVKLAEERDYLREERRTAWELVGESPAFAEVRRLIAQAGPSEASVLILGETGTGKEGVARALHEASPRARAGFVAVNCAAFAPGVLESELFGHEKGAFTGAHALRKGRLELADGGTLFLDEVGDLPLEIQVKLLRAIEQKSFERVGGNVTLRSDFRLISATHRDLEACVRQGTFRQDLYFRLAVFPLRLPPLRERGGDLLLLAEHFLRRRARRLRLPENAEALLRAYSWPGNVRELQNVIERAVLLSEGEVLRLDLALPAAAPAGGPAPARNRSLNELMDETEKALVADALRRAAGNQTQAAKLLGLERSTLQYKIKKHGLG